MSEETDAPQGGTEAEAVADTSQAEAAEGRASDNATEQDTGTDESGQADETGDTPKRKPWWEKRFDELTAKRYEAEREAAYYRGLAEAGGRQQQPAAPEGPPREDQFESYEDYEQARIDYAVEQRLQKVRQEEQRSTVLRTYEERAAKLRETATDYDLVVNDPTLKITPVMADVIRESDVGPAVAYHLGTNRAEAERIAALPAHRQAAELGKLEARLSAAPEAPKAQTRNPPPAPPRTVSGLSAGLPKDPEDMSMSEYIANAKAEGRI